MRRTVKAYFIPIGRPWKIEDSGNRIRVAANDAAEDHDEGVHVQKHAQIAAHQNER